MAVEEIARARQHFIRVTSERVASENVDTGTVLNSTKAQECITRAFYNRPLAAHPHRNR
jgi:hypothetical protein